MLLSAMNTRDALFTKLSNNTQTLSKSHKAFARFIAANYQKVAFTTITQLAELSGISVATIVRFVKAMEFSGYPAFQKEIRRIVRADLRGSERFGMANGFREDDSGLLSKILNKEIENLSYLRETFDEKKFREAVSAITTANKVLIAGLRSMAPLAQHLWFGLKKLEKDATLITSVTLETYECINQLDHQSLIIVIGFPRYFREIVDILHFAKEKGFKTITITDNPVSPLIGDITLYSPAESISFMAFHCAPMVLINAIIHETSLISKEHTLQVLERFEKLAETRNTFLR